MPDAAIVVANERQFADRAKELRDYLRRRCRMHVVIDVPAWNRSPDELESALMYRICTARTRPLLIAYIGHGAEPTRKRKDHGWAYGTENGAALLYPYARLVSLLRHREGSTMILNDCCFAGALNELALARPTGRAVGVISAASKGGYSYGDMTRTVIEAWSRGEEYVQKLWTRGAGREYPVSEVRTGPKLDRLFFPREPR